MVPGLRCKSKSVKAPEPRTATQRVGFIRATKAAAWPKNFIIALAGQVCKDKVRWKAAGSAKKHGGTDARPHPPS